MQHGGVTEDWRGARIFFRGPTMRPNNPASCGRATILVADDDTSFRHALRSALGLEGYEVVEASDGEMALDLLAAAATGKREPLDVVVLDVLMPFCSGLGVLEVMRKFRHPPPALLVTSFKDPSIDILARRLGAFRVLHKPVELDDVLATVLAAAKVRRSIP